MNSLPRSVLLTTEPLYQPLHRGLETLGVNVVEINNDAILPCKPNQILGCFVSFYGCLRSPIRHFWLKHKMNRAGIPLIAWNRDAPHYLNKAGWRLDLLDRFRLLDIYMTHTLIDSARQFADTYAYLANAADVDTWAPEPKTLPTSGNTSDEITYRYDVSFFGGMNGSRYKEDRDREIFFNALSSRLSASNIRHLFIEADKLSLSEQKALILSTKINLNYGARCEYQAKLASGLPERCYGIPALGGFLLCDQRTHAHTDFSVGIDWAEYDGLDDCVTQIKYWLNHFDEARRLANRTQKTVFQKHTYKHRAETILDILVTWHKNREQH